MHHHHSSGLRPSRAAAGQTNAGDEMLSAPPSPRWLRPLLLAAIGFTVGGLVRDLSGYGYGGSASYGGGGYGGDSTLPSEDGSSLPLLTSAKGNSAARRGDSTSSPRMRASINTAADAPKRPKLSARVSVAEGEEELQRRAVCVAKVAASARLWLQCTLKTPPRDLSLAWVRPNACGFTRHLYRDYDGEHDANGIVSRTPTDPSAPRQSLPRGGGGRRVRSLLAGSTLEFYGDSTLREVAGLLIGQADVPGALQKADANKGLRAPKYFVKKGPLSLLVEPPLATAKPPSAVIGHNRDSLLARIVFRFDFLALSLREPLVDVPSNVFGGHSTRESGGAHERQSRNLNGFFEAPAPHASDAADDARPPKRLVAISIASHGAKHLVTEMGLDGALVAADEDAIFALFTGAMEDYIAERVLGVAVRRAAPRRLMAAGFATTSGTSQSAIAAALQGGGSASGKEMPREERLLGAFGGLLRGKNTAGAEEAATAGEDGGSDAAQPLADGFVVVGQTFECGAMHSSQNRNFRKMAKHCPAMEAIVRAVWRQWERRSMAFLAAVAVSSADPSPSPSPSPSLPLKVTEVLHGNSSWRHLTRREAVRVAAAVAYLPPMYCHGEERGWEVGPAAPSEAQQNGGGDRVEGQASLAPHGRRDEALRDGVDPQPFRFDPSRPFCTRDGIHLRTKFLVHKLDALLNAMVGLSDCGVGH